MKALENAMTGVGIFFLALNTLGGIVSGIWLAIIGQWGAIGLGLLGIFLSHFLIGLALLPSFGLAGAAVALAKKGRRWGVLSLGFLSQLYIAALMAAWSALVVLVFASQADSRGAFIALLIWSYGVALGPWQYLHSQDAKAGRAEGSALLTAVGQIAFVVMVLVGVFLNASALTMPFVFLGVMLVAVLILTGVAYTEVDLMTAEAQMTTQDVMEDLDRFQRPAANAYLGSQEMEVRTDEDWIQEYVALTDGWDPPPCPRCTRRGFYGPRHAVPERKYFACKFCGYWQDVGKAPHPIIRYECEHEDGWVADWRGPTEGWICPTCGTEYTPEEAVPWPAQVPDHAWHAAPREGSQEDFRQWQAVNGMQPRPYGII